MLVSEWFQFNLFPGQGVCLWRARYANPILRRILPFRWASRVRIDYAVSLCSPLDEFDMGEGVYLATKRLEKDSPHDEKKGWIGTFYWSDAQWDRYIHLNMVTFALRKEIKPRIQLPYPWTLMIN